LSIRLKDLPPKAGKVLGTAQAATEDPMDATNATRKIPLANIPPYTWAASDEDSPLDNALLYTTEAISVTRSIQDVILSLKNAPTGNDIQVDVLKETGLNTNAFATILSVRPLLMINEFTSETSGVTVMFTDEVWQNGRRLQLLLTINDSNFAATGLKVTIKS